MWGINEFTCEYALRTENLVRKETDDVREFDELELSKGGSGKIRPIPQDRDSNIEDIATRLSSTPTEVNKQKLPNRPNATYNSISLPYIVNSDNPLETQQSSILAPNDYTINEESIVAIHEPFQTKLDKIKSSQKETSNFKRAVKAEKNYQP